jgi:tRNA threonylcarbamoyladenosine biosynthesis protein TsaE
MSSPEDTCALAAALSQLVEAGDVVVLVGEMGAGKTTFAKGFAAGLGVTEPVTSPTFTLVRHYQGRLPLHHVDVYRLERTSEVLDLGLGELLESGGVTIIEWGDVVLPLLPADHLEVRLSFSPPAEDARRIEVHARGRGWAGRRARLPEVLDPWTGGGAPC